jgi:tyrosyl-tRNA synthetase
MPPGEAARLINGGGVSLNGSKVESATQKLLAEDLQKDRFAIFRIGKAAHLIVYAQD